MDFNQGIPSAFGKGNPLPFFMSYPGYQGWGQERKALKDFEYLQQVYPLKVKGYQRRVQEILDKLDYDGAFVYDEYPDKYQLERLAKTVADILHKEDNSEEKATETPEELINMAQILVCNDIFKRRHNGRRDLYYY